MEFVTAQSLRRPEVVRWHTRMIERYTPPEGIKLTVVLPCSARKPYSKSRTHRLFTEYIQRGAGRRMGLVHEVMLTSPLGLVPRELEGVYPAAHYDTPVTGEWSTKERELALRLLTDYIKNAKTDVIAHVDGAYRDIVGELDIRTTGDNIRSDAALKELANEVSESLANHKKIKRDKIGPYRAVCDFQFGKGASKHLLPQGTGENRGRLFVDTRQVAALNPRTGCLALTLEGGEMLSKFGQHIIEISFKPEQSNIFSVGVEKAGDDIRVGDEVIVLYQGEVVGVGKAALCGSEMVKAKKGLAVALRHRLR